MHPECDLYNDNDSEDNVYNPKALRHLRLRHTKTTLGRMERRTALSLRPITVKSYADPHSPITYNSEESDLDLGVRRSARNRRQKYENMTWLADDQISKVGYPNLDDRGYSEEDSREAQETPLNRNRNIIYETRHSSRHDVVNGMRERRNLRCPKKYMFEFETTTNRCRRGGNGGQAEVMVEKEGKRSKIGSTISKENEKDGKDKNDVSRSNGKLKTTPENKDKLTEDSKKNDVEKSPKGEKKEIDQEYSDNEARRVLRTRRMVNRGLAEEKYTERTQRNERKESVSSSSSEGGRVYSLRERVPKKTNNAMREGPVIRSKLDPVIHTRRHYSLRRTRRKVSSSTEDSTDSEELCRKPSKYRTNSKTGHGKTEQIKSGSGSSKPMPINPEAIDNSVRFSSVGGLDGHIRSLKEMILLPMMYPEIFNQFKIEPPKGVLFYGPPGTGKTLLARALANECSFGSRKVSFFLRKGADLLSKWVGESEKQLRLLFEQAQEMKPSIIFFDEIDGLAPVRSSRQDQIHASIVSTLLALLDGLTNRGDVIVIGATNRIDAVDPALRRPGRFDRELFFPLPSKKERVEILRVHVSQWTRPPSDELIDYLAESAIGYCGSDLRALCSEAVIQSLRRTYPQVYLANHRLLLDSEKVQVEKLDFLRAKSLLVPASHRIAQGVGRKLLPLLQPLLGEPLKNTLSVLQQTFPHGLNVELGKVKISACVRPTQLLLLGDGAKHGQSLYLAPAILHHMEHIHVHVLSLASLFKETGKSPEESCLQIFNEARRNVPSAIYIPSIDEFWLLINETIKAIFLSQLAQLDPNIPVLILATADTNYSNLPEQIQNIFSQYRKEVITLRPPDSSSRKEFFKPLIIEAASKAPRVPRKRPSTPPPLPRAPTPPPTPLTETEAMKLFEKEERTLMELRIFLRDMCRKLANNKLFYMFTKPVDTDEVPDYTSIIKQPMDLETMMTKVDFYRYECAKDFLDDIELIVQNALEYNPAKSSADKQIRHRACSLRDYAHALIKNEMDSDFEDTCQEISKNRRMRKVSVTNYLPAYIQAPGIDTKVTSIDASDDKNEKHDISMNGVSSCMEQTSPLTKLTHSNRKRKAGSSWKRGILKKKKKKDRPVLSENPADDQNDDRSSGDESKENKPDGLSDSVLQADEDQHQNVQVHNTAKEVTAPLSINCDSLTTTSPSSLLQSSSSKKILNELLSPSQLLDDPLLDIDDIDQALVEEQDEIAKDSKHVDVNKEELGEVLKHVVEVTDGHSLQSLLDLHNQLSKIVRLYSRSHNRKTLPKDLQKELVRYKNEHVVLTGRDSHSTVD
ncbi:ATPase family AAA domain-containing protein 2 [Agrilus planipennis]|uniref:ATPase family AAA domain-containing protein 2 n=1 Tax=Agrilus planipennis TaxID=224129 RepID=A0A1W4XEY6_AGRPL|nr:ATPase family AAA domain-containing protein 2 [Agrilus planipennis]